MAKYSAKYYKRSRKSSVARSRRPTRKASRPFKTRARRNRIQHIRVKSLNLGTSFSKTSLRPNKLGYQMKKKYWLGAKNIWQSNYTGNVAPTGAQGFTQNAFQVGYFSPLDMNNGLTAYSIGQGATGDTNNTNRVYWNKCIADVLMTNSSNVNALIDIYSFSTKKDALNYPKELWYKGIANEFGSTTTDLTVANYGLTPLDSVAVTSMYKCYKVTHIMLAPGQSHKHSHTQHLCRPISNEYQDQLVEGTDASARGITHFDLIVCRSATVESGTNNAGTGIAPVKINYYVVKKYEFKYVFDMSTNYKYDTMPVEPTTGNAIYNQGSGASATPAVI